MGADAFSRRSGGRKKTSRNSTHVIEPLERRTMLASAAANVIARFADSIDVQHTTRTVPISVSGGDFTLAGGKTVLGFHVLRASGQTFNPAAVQISTAQGK